MSMPPPFNQPPVGAPPVGAVPAGSARGRGANAPTRQRSRTYLVIFLILALAVGLLVFIGSGIGSPGVYVLRAKQPIPAMASLDNSLFEVVSVPEKFLVDGAIRGSSPEAARRAARLSRATSQYPIDKGAQLTTSAISTSSDLVKDLGPDERLISVSANVSRAVAGQLRAGDRVDVVVVGDGSLPVASTLLQDVEIVGLSLSEDQINRLADDQVSAASDGANATRKDRVVADPVPGIYTLRVKDSAVAPLAVADQLATIYLVYRSADATPSSAPTVTLRQALCTPAGGSGVLPDVCVGR